MLLSSPLSMAYGIWHMAYGIWHMAYRYMVQVTVYKVIVEKSSKERLSVCIERRYTDFSYLDCKHIW
jgi:hypothetical protein